MPAPSISSPGWGDTKRRGRHSRSRDRFWRNVGLAGAGICGVYGLIWVLGVLAR